MSAQYIIYGTDVFLDELPTNFVYSLVSATSHVKQQQNSTIRNVIFSRIFILNLINFFL